MTPASLSSSPSHPGHRPRRPWTLSAKLSLIGAVVLLLALAVIALTLSLTWRLEGGAAAVNEAGRMRMQTWRLAQALGGGDSGEISGQLEQFEHSLRLLRSGDPARPLFLPQDTGSLAAFAAVQADWQRLRADWAARPAPSQQQLAAQAEAFVLRIDVFVSAIELQLARLTTWLNALQFAMVGLALAAALALLYAGYLLIFNPLGRLQAGLARVRQGDLDARVQIHSGDEFGALSEGFNQMAETLQQLYQSLEAKVEEKTLGLEAQNARLAALYKAAAWVSEADSLDELAQGFARQLRAAAQADATAVRWSDEGNRRYLMLASDGLPPELLDEEQCLPTGDCFCGQAQGQARTRIIPIRPWSEQPAAGQQGQQEQLGQLGQLEEAELLGHCERAGFRTVISVPLRLQERIVGELNLFYRQPRTLGDEDRSLLETLASHLAGAIESLRVAALQRESALAEERGMLARELHDSIAQGLSFLKIQVALLRQALQRAEATQIAATVAELDAGVQESLADVRALLLHFRTRTNAEDIGPALQTCLRKFEHQTGLSTHLSIEGQGLPLAPDVQVQVLHVLQEALSNVRKHAGARAVWLEVQQAPRWRFELRDDGCGIADDAPEPDETHVGLRIMKERAERIGAEVELSSVAGAGTCVVLTLAARPPAGKPTEQQAGAQA
ncbi:type IV pili methyl-accepting chemotaxis transducer N-terminal domain-containing protein [Paucibacter sp. B51]|uniref:type IV pili methyl-accepting chemotaxis transducer N-terminal domain-containing protein n=1 Tax=Paucibacter sp. B51 TaxID=2993315 RepID=UPI0022EBF699|nr:type IV pili methyl-accepting chemotaxis transducer N-terminal domain-containing protein [Paucibacter sp. B51]